MGSFSHLTPRYILDRSKLWLWERRHVDAPWMTPEAVALLDRLLRSTDRLLEWGAGRSTGWFLKRVSTVVSVEHNPKWYAVAQRTMGPRSASQCLLVTQDGHASQRERYVQAAEARGMFDVILVDGLYRDSCAVEALSRISPGGLLIIDDVERYLPSPSRSPCALSPSAPPASDQWAAFAEAVLSWRCIWTSSGVKDTALWFRP